MAEQNLGEPSAPPLAERSTSRIRLFLRRCFRIALLLPAFLAILSLPGHPQQRIQAGQSLRQHPLRKEEPVTFTADSVTYDRAHALVIASGHVEAWQDDHVLRADRVVFDRKTGVATAEGNVVLLEPDGEVLFADHAELTQGMREAVLRGIRTILTQNGRLVANGMRRTSAEVNELTRVIYSACNLCKNDPTAPPFWQVLASSGVQNIPAKRIEFEDVTMELFGVPIFYSPYLSMPDPSVKRASGFLVPDFGSTTFLGQFFTLPYYYVIDKTSDLTITGTVDTLQGPELDLLYRKSFNSGTVKLEVAGAEDENSLQGLLFGTANFNWDENWRYGANVNLVTSANYLRDFRMPEYGQDILESTPYIEGFGQGAYARLDAFYIQGLLQQVLDNELPLVLPRYEYSFVSQPDSLGGRVSLDFQAFNVVRPYGASDQQAGNDLRYQLPVNGPYGEQWTFILDLAGVAYNAYALNLIPDFSSISRGTGVIGIPTAAVRLSWPLIRQSGDSSIIVEPITQVLMRPTYGTRYFNGVPNEDALDPFFTDANLFAFNRFPGLDRFESGPRADLGLHVAWLQDGHIFDGLIGQSYRTAPEPGLYPTGLGLNGTISDIVGRAYFAPSPWVDFTERFRLNHRSMNVDFDDFVGSFGPSNLRFNLGYFYSNVEPFYYLDGPPGTPQPQPFLFPRNEVTYGVNTKYGPFTVGGYIRQNLHTGEPVMIGGHAQYENECFILAFDLFQLYTSYNGISHITVADFNFTFKTLGQFHVPAL